MPVGVVRFTERMEALSSAVLNGGDSAVSAVFIMQVSKNYDHPDPAAHADAVRRELGLPEDSLGMMTAAEVRHVFNVREVEFEGMEVTAIATAGLSNRVRHEGEGAGRDDQHLRRVPGAAVDGRQGEPHDPSG